MERPTSINRVWSRPHMSERTISQMYTFQDLKSENILNGAKRFIRKNYTPSRTCLERFFYARLPSFKWLREYKVKENLLKDVIGGVTIGIVEIPLSMGYSLAAGLPAVNGLYVTFFSSLMYFFFGTSRHLSIGTYGIVAIMLDSYMVTYEGKLFPSEADYRLAQNVDTTSPSGSKALNNIRDTKYVSSDPEEAKVLIAMTFAFYSGIIQIILGIVHAGIGTRFLSDTVVAAFTTGAAYHLVFGELHYLLGVKTKHSYGFFKIIEFVVELFTYIRTINLATCIISAICIFELFMVKHFINHRYKKKLIAPIPIEFIVISLATLFSYLFRFEERFGVKTLGEIPLGFPQPKIPPLNIFPEIYLAVFEVAFVSFALNISMAKVFAKKYNYEINPNQEFFAYGIGNLINSFFNGFPSSVGLSKSVKLDDIGVRSLLHAFITSMIILVIIVGLGFLFKWMPIACLAALIVAALIPMLLEVKLFLPLYRRSKIEGLAWLATFLSVVIFDVDFGLYIGIGFALFLFIIQKQRAFSFVMGNIPDTDIYEAINVCKQAVEIEGIKIVRYESSIFYANVDNFVYRIFKLSGVNPNEVVSKLNKLREDFESKQNNNNPSKLITRLSRVLSVFPFKRRSIQNRPQTVPSVSGSHQLEGRSRGLDEELSKITESIKIKDIIIDFSCVNLIDTMGLDAILKMMETYKQIGVQLHFSHCKRNLIKRFEKSPLKHYFSYDFIYPTTHDAVLNIIFSRTATQLGVGLENSINFGEEYTSINVGLDPSYYAKPGQNEDDFNAFENLL